MNRMFVALFALLMVAGLSFAGISVTNYTVSKANFQPGDVGIATITITNPTGTPRVSGLSMTVYNPSEISVTGSSTLSDIESGGTAIVSIPFKIREDAKPGIYLLSVAFIGFSQATSSSTQTTTTNTVSVPISIVDEPILSLTSDKQVIGGIDEVTLSITNDGGTAKNLILQTASAEFYTTRNSNAQLLTTGMVGLYGVDQIYIGELIDTKNVSVILDARNATDGPVDVPFYLIYTDEIGNSISETKFLRLTVKNEILDLRFNQQSSLITGQDGTLTMQVVNNGEALNDVRVSFVNDSVRLKDKNEIKVGNLSAGETATVSALVYNDLAPGLNLVSAKVTWTDKDVRKEQVMNIPLTIDSDADVGVYLESNPSPLVAGQDHTISVLVSNVGSYGINNVDVGMSSSGLESLDVTPRQYIGSLATDDFSTVQFKVRAGAAGDYPIDVNVRYRDASGEWVNKTLTQTATITQAASGGGESLFLIVGAMAVIAALVYWFFIRKKPAKD